MLVLSGDVPLRARRDPGAARRGGRGRTGARWRSRRSPSRARSAASSPTSDGDLERIVEARDATADELAIRTVNAGLYALPAPAIFDVPALARAEQRAGRALPDRRPDRRRRRGPAHRSGRPRRPGRGARRQRPARARARPRAARSSARSRGSRWAASTLLAPERPRSSREVEVGADTLVHAGVTLAGRTRIGARRDGRTRAPGSATPTIADGAVIEPYSRARRRRRRRRLPRRPLRPPAPRHRCSATGARVGNFVEVKNVDASAPARRRTISPTSATPTVGDGANIGAGVVTCNYDGATKHRTEIGDRRLRRLRHHARGAGPRRRGRHHRRRLRDHQDVPAGALAVERSPQRTVEGWAKRRRAPKPPLST